MAENTVKGFDARRSKESVNYGHSKKCQMCDHFQGLSSCELVDGSISPDGVCDLYEMKAAGPKYHDKQFYQSEYDKANKK
jgi:hypothetical protein